MKKKKIWRQGLSVTLACALTATALPAMIPLTTKAAEAELLKAGPINVTKDSVTQDQPFAAGTGGSQNFRIPAFIVTQKGNLLAAADARYATTSDGGGLDTIASVSTDNGKTWNYSFPLYFPDSEGYSGTSATTIIDPALVQGADGAIYCIADVNPTGITTLYTSPGEGTGYVKVNGVDRLAVTNDYNNASKQPTDSDQTTYPYYVGDYDDAGYAKILKRADDSETGYGVDKWYNLYKVENGEYKDTLTQKQVNSQTDIQQNIFYKGSELHVYNTGYMMYAKTYDDGFTWTDPEILNPQIKRPTKETALLVSPGQGMLTSDGTIVIPFYDHGDGEENASIIWSDDNGKTWKRSNDVPGAAAGGCWSSESEVIELEGGTLRMFFRSGTGVVCYADAVRNTSGDYVFTKPVKTGVSCTSTCNVTAISYSKTIDGKQAILVAAPGGSGRANGKVFTFLVEADKTLTLKNSYSVNSGTYQYSCMSELKNGTVGLLWENGGGSIRYDNYDIAQLAPGASVDNLELGVDLKNGETYTRSYQVAADKKTGITKKPDEKVATAELQPVDGEEKTDIPLYAHTAGQASSLDSFSKTEDTVSLEDAEFKITSTGATDIYTIYNEKTQQYLVNTIASSFFTTTSSNMKIAATANSNPGTFRICQTGGTRFVVFYNAQMNFNANTNYSADFDGSYELVLLEKQDKESADDVIPGYKRVSRITSGKNYLISYIYKADNKDHVIILYPANGTSAQTKLVGEKTTRITPTQCTLKITGVGEGTTTAVVDGVTYNINCEGNEKIRLATGESCVIGSSEATVADTNIAVAETKTVTKDKVSDYNSAVANDLSTFKTEVNANVQMQDMEFTVKADGDAYTLYNAKTKNYLRNSNAKSYFTTAKARQKITKADGQDSFEIQSIDDNSYVFFYNQNMGFDRVSAKGSFADKGDFALEFLEKQSAVSDSDPIPGYKRVSEITSGKNYLIAQYITKDSKTDIILLYPVNGIENQTKLYRQVKEKETTLTALKSGKTTVTIDGKTYDVIVDSGKEDPTPNPTPIDQNVQKAQENVKRLLTQADELIRAGQGSYDDASWRAFIAAYEAAKKGGNDVTSLQKLADALTAAQSNLTLKNGTAVTDATGVFTYKVTGADTVEVTGITEKGKKKAAVKISSTMKSNGKTYKITSVAANALKGNRKMTSLTIGNNVVTIGKNAFANCTKLKKVTVNGNKLKTIGKNAFSGDKKLKTINMKKVKSLKTVGKSAFKGVSKKITVRVPKNKKAAYVRIFKKGGIAANKIK